MLSVLYKQVGVRGNRLLVSVQHYFFIIPVIKAAVSCHNRDGQWPSRSRHGGKPKRLRVQHRSRNTDLAYRCSLRLSTPLCCERDVDSHKALFVMLLGITHRKADVENCRATAQKDRLLC